MKKKSTLIALFAMACVSANAESITLEIPDAETFAAQWTVIDNNAATSANTWTYADQTAKYEQDKKNAADDWLISPAVDLVAGKAYTVKAYLMNGSTFSSDKQRFAVTVGTAATIEAQSTVLVKDEAFQSKLYVDRDGVFTPTESGKYYLGVHCYSLSYMGDAYFQKFVVEETVTYPSAATNLVVTAGEAGALKADLAWTWPSTDNCGGTLTELTGAKIYRNGELLATTTDGVVGGQGAWTDNSLTAAGTYTYKIVTYNANGDSKTAAQVASPWIGKDKPKSVTNVVATVLGDSQVSLTFDVPTEGANGGYVDASAFTYKITRTPGGVLEEAFAGQLPYVDEVSQLGQYYYTVAPTYEGSTALSAQSNTVIAGGALDVPYSESFDSESSLALYTIIDGNSDGKTWKYYTSKKCAQFWGGTEADEWLITPSIALKAGKAYKLAYKAGLENAASEKNYKDYDVTIGQGATVEAQTRVLKSEQLQSALMETKEVVFSVNADGNYNLAFHCHGASSSYAIFVDDVNLAETEISPLAPTDLSVEAGARGALSATVTFTPPTQTKNGEDIATLSKVELYRGEELVDSMANVATSAQVTLTDSAVPAAGIYTYEVKCHIPTGSEKASVTSMWIGEDTPAAADSVVATVGEDAVQITFVAPTAGKNGGYIDASKLKYNVTREPDEVTVAENVTGTSVTDSNEAKLGVYSYTVATVYGDSIVGTATSNTVKLGGAVELPYSTNFADASDAELFTIVDANNDGKTWAYNATNHRMGYTAFKAANDWVYSPQFAGTTGSYVLTFNMSTYSSRYAESFEVVLSQSTNPEDPYTVLGTYTDYKAALSSDSTINFDITDAMLSKLQSKALQRGGKVTGYIGFHCTSSDPWGLYLNSMSLEQTVSTGITSVEAEGRARYSAADQTLYFAGNASVEVVNMNGQVVLAQEGCHGAANLSELAAGVYVAVVKGASVERVKLIKK